VLAKDLVHADEAIAARSQAGRRERVGLAGDCLDDRPVFLPRSAWGRRSRSTIGTTRARWIIAVVGLCLAIPGAAQSGRRLPLLPTDTSTHRTGLEVSWHSLQESANLGLISRRDKL
jgi:hypothetical protein